MSIDDDDVTQNESSNELLRPNKYDNEITVLYKYAYLNSSPVRIIFVSSKISENEIESGDFIFKNLVYNSLYKMISKLLNQGYSISNIYSKLSKINNLINIDDVLMTYYEILTDESDEKNMFKILNKAYNKIDERIIAEKFENEPELENYYKEWKYRISLDMEEEREQLMEMLLVQSVIIKESEKDLPDISPISMRSSVIGFSPKINDEDVVPAQGIDIFAHSVASKYVPFICYLDEKGIPHYNVFTGDKLENEPDFENTIIPASKLIGTDIIYLRLWLGDHKNDGSENLRSATNESFFTVIYDLKINEVQVETPIGIGEKKNLVTDEDISTQRVQNSLPLTVFGLGKEINVRGEFNIWNFEIDENSFLDMLITDPVLSVYLYVEENIKPYAFKKQLDVHYRSLFSDIMEGTTGSQTDYISNSAFVSAKLTQKITTKEEIIQVLDVKTNLISDVIVPKGIKYVFATLKGYSRDVILNFIPVFQILLNYYFQNNNDIMKFYDAALPEFKETKKILDKKRDEMMMEKLQKTKKYVKKSDKVTKNKMLQSIAPEIFVKRYARRCQAEHQPIIVDEDEAKIWKRKVILNTKNPRPIMRFPKEEPNWLFTCPGDKVPYIGVKPNNLLPNKEEFPYIPCCFPSEQFSKKSSPYNKYMQGKKPSEKKGAKAEKIISTRKIVAAKQLGQIPIKLELIFNKFTKKGTFARLGVPRSKSSLLHCVLEAIDDDGYLNLNDEDEKEKYVNQIRQEIADNTEPFLLKQELYDYSNQEIINNLENVERDLDPSLFFRALEEFFDINIYVFTFSPIKGGDPEIGEIDLPRFKIFHSHPLRPNRRTVLILKLTRETGAESDNIIYPHCELIIIRHDETVLQKIFVDQMTYVCQEILQRFLHVYTWTVENDKFDINENIYYHIDHMRLFENNPPISQYLDYNGKLRALILNINNKYKMTIAVVPSQPENLPISNAIERVSLELVLKLINNPSGATINENNLVDGLWFPIMSLKYGEYVPIIPTDNYQGSIEGPPNPLFPGPGINQTQRLRKMKHDLNIITQLIKWIFALSINKYDIDPQTFSDRYLVIKKENKDSSNYYDLSKVEREFTLVNSPEQAIKRMSEICPTLFRNSTILMYNEEFKIRILNMLTKYYETKVDEPKISLPTHIQNYYRYEEDFGEFQNSKIFLGTEDLILWRDSLKNSKNYSENYSINTTIDVNLSAKYDPYFYQDEDKKIYIIQNADGGLLDKALNIAHIWRKSKVNLGDEVVPIDVGIPYMIYGISESSTMIPIEDHTGARSRFSKVLYYGTQQDKLLEKEGQYAAILEIL